MKSTGLGARRCETLFATHGRRRLKRKSLTEIRSSSFTCETTESESLLKLPIRAPVLVIGACLVCANVPRDLAGGWSLERAGSRNGDRVECSCGYCLWRRAGSWQILVLAKED